MSYSKKLKEIAGEDDFDFQNEKATVVKTYSSSVVTMDGFRSLQIIPLETTETSLDDFGLNAVSFNIENIIDNVSFDIRATAAKNASGLYTIKYKVKYV